MLDFNNGYRNINGRKSVDQLIILFCDKVPTCGCGVDGTLPGTLPYFLRVLRHRPCMWCTLCMYYSIVRYIC